VRLVGATGNQELDHGFVGEGGRARIDPPLAAAVALVPKADGTKLAAGARGIAESENHRFTVG
jgi:hypothetical protein